jgi:quinol-cytochrome oxidoreductase complex cytochrome b subunit
MLNYKHGYMNLTLKSLWNYFQILSVKYHFFSAISGFFIILTIVFQLISGTLLAFSLIPEPMLIPIVRDEEDLEDLYTDDFFWLHERGVDLIFIFSYYHLLRKLYIMVFYIDQEFSWKSGVFSFLIFQVVTFLGLILCCTHLSDITLTIACNIMHTFFAFKGKVYWWLFTDKRLNTDTLVRLAYAHYLSAFYLFFLSIIHAIDMHYDWKADYSFDGLNQELYWFDEALLNEIKSFSLFLLTIFIVGLYLFSEPEALSYEIFMWGDIGNIVDVRFMGVAPHWYFRPFMAWLIVCPHHKTGIFGLIYFMVILFYQVNLKASSEVYNNQVNLNFNKSNNNLFFFQKKKTFLEVDFFYLTVYWTFFMALMYCTTFLPYGRFYNRMDGNLGMLISYFFVFFYLTFFNIHSSLFFQNSVKQFFFKKINL